MFRIEDATGHVLRRILGARDMPGALALYWRGLGAALPGVTMSKDLERRIRQVRAATVRSEMHTPELPFESQPVEAAHRASRRGRPPRAQAQVPQSDLFGEALLPGGPDTSPAVDPAVAPPESELPSEPAPAIREPYTLDAHLVGLQRVDAGNLRPTDRTDTYLYHVTNGTDARAALGSGLLVSASDPMILTERQGVAYWLSVLAEDYDYILDGPADFVVLRLRRTAVEELLETDPRASRSAGCPCYLLTGGPARFSVSDR